MHLVGVPFVHLTPTDEGLIAQPQEFVNERRHDGTFRWKFMVEPPAEPSAAEGAGLFTQHDDPEHIPSPEFGIEDIKEDEDPLLKDNALKHLSNARQSSSVIWDHVTLWWEGKMSAVKSACADVLYLLRARAPSFAHGALDRAVLRTPDWNPIAGPVRAYYSYLELVQRGHGVSSLEMHGLLTALALNAYRPESPVDTASLALDVFERVGDYPRSQRQLMLHNLTRTYFNILLGEGQSAREVVERLAHLGASFTRRDWERTCHWLFQQQDIEAFVEASGLFELDVGMHTMPVLSDTLKSALATARPYALNARLKANGPYLIQLLYQRGVDQSRVKPEQRDQTEADAFRRCLLFLEAAKHMSGLNVSAYVKSMQVILALYARSGSAEQLKETLQKVKAQSKLTVSAPIVRSVLHGCARIEDKELNAMGLELFDQFLERLRPGNDVVAPSTLGLALSICRQSRDYRRAKQYIKSMPDMLKHDGIVSQYLRVLSAAGKAADVMTFLRNNPTNLNTTDGIGRLNQLAEALLNSNRLVDAVYVTYATVELGAQRFNRASVDVLRHLYQLRTPDADLVGMALARDMCQRGLFAEQMQEAASGVIDLHGLNVGAAKMLTLAFLEDVKVARRRFMVSRAKGKRKRRKLGPNMLILSPNRLNPDLTSLYYANRTNKFSKQIKTTLSEYGLSPKSPSGLQLAVALCDAAPTPAVVNFFQQQNLKSAVTAKPPAWMKLMTPGTGIDQPWDPSWPQPSSIRSSINIITGKGINSKSGPVIRPMVFQLLTNEVNPPVPSTLRMNKAFGSVLIYPQFVAEWFDEPNLHTTAWDASAAAPATPSPSHPDVVLAGDLAQEYSPPTPSPAAAKSPDASDQVHNYSGPDPRGQWWVQGRVPRAAKDTSPLLDATKADSKHSRHQGKASKRKRADDADKND
eukprot:TRINITY_DN11673_c0_g1_i1.p1 TRINITY_DN11673_c0_g1~~TRINITY_DN11673_c0_g1_i1.p1  ORF type:complete len:937 (+),score=235.40 TRINITY_DN11673_c0_g1_i1:47-2812(+)